jgi:hypothetical protein
MTNISPYHLKVRRFARDRLLVDLPSGMLLTQVLIWQPIGLLLLAFHVLLVCESIWLFPIVPLIGAWLYAREPLAGILVYFQFLIYQNLMTSLFSPGMAYQPTYVMLGGTNFLALCLIAPIALNRLIAPYWWRETRQSVLLRRVVWIVLAALVMTVFYSLLGAVKAGPTSAAIYFRNFTSPLFAVLVGLDLGRIWGYRTIGPVFMYSVALALVLGFIEYCYPLEFYDWIHEVTYYQLKYYMAPTGNTFFVPQDIVAHFTNVLFNVSGGDTHQTMNTFRFGGPIITPTSFAYIMCVVGLLAISLRRTVWLVVVLPLLLLEGAKGSLLLMVLSVALWVVWKSTRSKRAVMIAGVVLSTLYVGSGIVIGLQSNDYHVIGFLGGVHSLVGNPLGHGIGVGGNLSADANAGFKMDGPGGFTHLGADFALESAIGVLFFQTGFASLLIFAVFFVLVYTAPLGELVGNQLRPVNRDILVFAVALIMVNGVFQEEAYSPYAAGMIVMMCGCIVGNGRRPLVEYMPSLRHQYRYQEASA